MSFSNPEFVTWLRTVVFPVHNLGPIQGIAGWGTNAGLMGDASVSLYPQGAAMAFLSRMVGAAYIDAAFRQPESRLQREWSSTALQFLLSGGTNWSPDYGKRNPYSKAVVQQLLKKYPVGGVSNAAKQTRKLRQIAGDYAGTVDRAALNGRAGGSVLLTAAANGAVTGTLRMNGRTYSVNGSVDPEGRLVAVATLASGGGYKLDLVVRQSGTPQAKVTGSIEAAGQKATLAAAKDAWSKRNPATAYAGKHPLKLAAVPSSVQGNLPRGQRSAQLTVGPDGTVRLSGRLADKVPFSWSGRLGADGSVAIHADASGQGNVIGTIKLDRKAGKVLPRGSINWNKPSAGRRAGFSAVLRVTGS